MRTYKRLSATQVDKLAKARQPGMYPDGDGLYLSISRAGTASWIYRFMIAGRRREMGLGPLRDIGLAKARERAYEARAQKRDGTDPVAARQARRQGAAVARAKTKSFEQCAREYITAKAPEWRSPIHAKQWVSSLASYVFPRLGKLPVAAIDLDAVMLVLKPIWNEKTETASRVRGRIESVLDWATVRGYRSGDNPARWRGHLDKLLPKKSKIATVKHHPALPYNQVAGFISDLRARSDDDPGLRALDLAILTASRTKEVLLARWDEIRWDEREWVRPPEHMKGNREHRVPLSDAAIAVLEQQRAIRTNDFIFAGDRSGHASEHTLDDALKALGRGDVTAHGFRSSFTDWASEETSFAHEVVEIALAHKVGNATEAAYRRGDKFAKRRQLADAWAAFCAGGADVISLAKARSA